MNPQGATDARAQHRLTMNVSKHSLFLVMRNRLIQETSPLDEALRRVEALLPASWRLSATEEVTTANAQADAYVDLAGQGGEGVRFAVEVKQSGTVSTSVALAVLRDLGRKTELPVLFVSDYIGPSLRAALASEQVSFADATGWIRIVSDRPLLLLTGQGADRSPRPRTSSSVTRLNGVAASRTIRALTVVDLPCGVRQLATVAEVSPGSVSKLLATLAAEGSVDRDSSGAVAAVRARDLVRRWIQDYSFAKSNRSVGYYIAPRGLDRTLSRLTDQGGITLTGAAAARRLLPASTTSVVPLRLLALYTASPATLAREQKLIPADPPTANLVIATPQDPSILPDPDGGHVALAPAALVLADLLTLPGRADAEADQLLDALAATNSAWREAP